MDCKTYTSRDKWIIAIVIGILYCLVASPFVYGAMDNLLKSILPNYPVLANGAPTAFGLLLHGVIFTLIIRGLMRF